MKPEKLKSGNWRCKVYLGMDENGKKLFKSVTAPTRKEAIAKAAELALDDKKIKQLVIALMLTFVKKSPSFRLIPCKDIRLWQG